MTARFECRTEVAAPPEAVFDLSLDIDLHADSMRRSRERAVGGVTSGRIDLGQDVTWRAWHFGVPIRMTSRIVELTRPIAFVDEQVQGPFAAFRHTHRFVAVADGTRMLDEVVLRAPLGWLGRLAEPVLRGYLRQLIERRNRMIREVAERGSTSRRA